MTDGQRDGLGMRKCRKVNAAEQMSWKCTREERRGEGQRGKHKQWGPEV